MTTILTAQQFKLASETVRYQPGYVMWKSPDLSYLASNDYSSQVLGFNNADDFIGVTDFELRCEAAEYAELMRAYTSNLFSRNEDGALLQFFHFKNGYSLMYVKSTIVKNHQEQQLALILSGEDITYQSILNLGVLMNPYLQDKIAQKQSFIFELREKYHQLSLGKRQSQCLFYYLSGYVAKQIAYKMGISKRTVEAHLAQIKSLLECNNRAQLHEKSIELGLLSTIIK